jgi:hypothetical protein
MLVSSGRKPFWSCTNEAIEQMQGDLPWGRVLDAGTGAHSLTWISSLQTDSWTAVTMEDVRIHSYESFGAVCAVCSL